MQIDNLERQILIHLIDSEKSISSERLAELCNTSRISIRSRIDPLNQKIKEFGIEILTLHSSGFMLHIADQETASQSLPRLLYTISRSQYNLSDERYRSDFIIRALLTSKEYVSAQAICDSLFLSYSAFHRELAEVQKELDFFHLKIASRRNYGYTIEGNEWNKRTCLLFEHKRFMRLSEEKKMAERSFGEIFLSFNSEFNPFRLGISTLLKDWPEYQYSFLDFPKVYNYLFLLRARHSETHSMHLMKVQADTIKKLPSIEIAKAILQKNAAFLGFQPNEKEIDSYAMILEAYRSLSRSAEIPEQFQISVMDECEALLQRINLIYHFDLNKVPEHIYDALRCDLYLIHMHQLFDIPNDLENLFPQIQSHSVSYDLVGEFRRCYRELFAISLSEDLALMVFYTCRHLMQSQDYHCGTLRIAILSLYGREYARIIASGMENEYVNDISSITPIEFVPMRDDIEYDILLTDIENIYFSKDDHVHLWLNPIEGSVRIPSLDQYLQKEKHDIINRYTGNEIHITDCRDTDGVIKTIASAVQKDTKLSAADIAQDIQLQCQSLSSLRKNDILVFTPARKLLPSMIRIMINRSPLTYDGHSVQVFVFCSYDRSSQKERLLIGATLDKITKKTQSEWISLMDHQLDLSTFLYQTN